MLALLLALTLAQAEPPHEARQAPPPAPPPPPSAVTRSLLATAGGSLAGGASLGIALLLAGQNPRFDTTFATGALASLLITGVAFTIHQALGGHGEITLSFLLCAVVVAGSALLASVINPGHELGPYLTVAIGSVPAAAAAVLGLEGTTPAPRAKAGVPHISVGPTGFFGTF
jgi:hypothetical protein